MKPPGPLHHHQEGSAPASPARWHLRASPVLGWWVSVLHAAAALGALASGLERALVLLALGTVALHAIRCWSLHVSRRHPASVVSIRWAGEATVVLGRRSRPALGGRLLPDTYLHPQLVVVRVQLFGRSPAQSVILGPDSLPGDEIRRLRMVLSTLAR